MDPLVTANQLFVEENYEDAQRHYDEAVQKAPSAAAFLGRAQNAIKLKNYIDAISDADAAIKLEPNNSNAHLRKGIALFYTDEFASAKTAFQQAAKLGNNQSTMWLRKCNAELSLEEGGSGTASTPASSSATAASKAADEKSAAKVSASSSSSSSAQAPAAVTPAAPSEPLATKVRHSHYQNASQVFLTLFAKNLKKENVDVKFGDRELTVNLRMPDSSVYAKEWKLFAPIVSAQCTLDITPFKVEIGLKKQQAGLDWDTLEEKEINAVKRANVVDGKAVPVYPTSSQKGKNVDWDQLNQQQKKDEEEEPASGDAGLNKLFQKIYGDGDENTRRAMIKSYQTSGGTVLSTNWKEVAEKDYEKERSAPKGQEFQKWGD